MWDFRIIILCVLLHYVSITRTQRIPQKWSNGVVPYQISDKFSPAEMKAILEAIPVINEKTCVRFVPYKDQTSYIKFGVGLQCQAATGRTGGAQTVFLAKNCLDKRSILRELMHVLGFNDEHLRSDRDQFLTVNRNNIKQQDWIFYDKLTDAQVPRFSQPYDFDSVLQRPANWKVDPAAGPNAVTMFVTKDKATALGQSQTLTHMDINKINAFYGCKQT